MRSGGPLIQYPWCPVKRETHTGRTLCDKEGREHPCEVGRHRSHLTGAGWADVTGDSIAMPGGCLKPGRAQGWGDLASRSRVSISGGPLGC